ncbi:MAG: VOC family protein [Actinomycetota bacterium]|nr:VOC family protein [Actinomycetota bacterium]
MTTVFPILQYRDAKAAIDFLERAFGFERAAVHEDEAGAVAHAELKRDSAYVMVSTHRPDSEFGRIAPPPGSAAVYVATEGVDELHDRAKAAGAEIAMSLRDTDYGSRDFSARDPEGNVWSFGTYAPA